MKSEDRQQGHQEQHRAGNKKGVAEISTAASPLMVPIHDRMPALLRPEDMNEWLAGSEHWNFQPFTGPLVVTPCESPLVKRRPASDSQPDLF